MNFSQNDFDRNAKALISAFALSEKKCIWGQLLDTEDRFVLRGWRLKQDTRRNSSLYLSHPPVTISTSMSSIENKQPYSQVDFSTRETVDDLEDEEIIVDDQCHKEVIMTNGEGNTTQQFITQWTFSVVYSTTYQTPTLYFNVQEMNGNPVGRQRLLQILRHEHMRSKFEFSNDFPVDLWEFVSQEEHPMTGLASFFLHPCQSAQKLKLLTTVTEEETSIDAGLEHNSTKDHVLWAWMSMILPAVGHNVPPSYFQHIRKCIANQPEYLCNRD